LVQEDKNKLDISESILQYQHALLERQDSKAESLFTVLTLTSAVVVFMGSLVSEKLELTPAFLVAPFVLLLIVYFLVFMFVIFYALRVLGPHVTPLRKDLDQWEPSISFYQGILSRKPEEYVSVVNTVTAEQKVLDNARQAYIVADILNYKVINMKKALEWMPVMFFSFTFILILGIMIFLVF